MFSSCDGSGPRLGTVRTLCLLLIAVGLLITYAMSYIDRYKYEVCTDQVQMELHRQQFRRVPASDDDDDVRWRPSNSRSKRTRRKEKESRGNGRNDGDIEDNEEHDGNTVEKERRKANETSALMSSVWDYNWDVSADDVKVADRNNVPDRTLILVRHGQYDLTTEQLTDLGRVQAEMTGRRLRQTNVTFTEIVHSTMDRAAETARIIHKCLGGNVPIRADEMLVEGGPIPPQPTITYWGLPQKTYHRDGPRMEAAFRKYFHRGDKSLQRESFQILVGHGNIFRFFALRSLQLSRDAWMRVFIAHASITTIHIRSDGTVAMTKFGDAGHFPVSKVTY